ERALIAELLLRGPQTTGELRTHASRMMPLDNVAYVTEIVAELSRRDPPIVREVARAPGQSAVRFAHTFYEAGEAPPAGASIAVAMSSSPSPPSRPASSLEQRVVALEERVAELSARLSEIHPG